MRVRAVLALLGTGLLAFIALHILESSVAALGLPLSAYALGRHEWLWQVAMIASGAAMFVYADGMHWRTLSFADAALVLAGLGLVVLAISRTDPWYPWERLPTPVGAVHLIGTFTALFAFGVGANATPGRGILAWLARAYFGVFVLGIAAVGIAIEAGMNAWFVGMIERAMLAIALLWVATATRKTTHLPHHQ